MMVNTTCANYNTLMVSGVNGKVTVDAATRKDITDCSSISQSSIDNGVTARRASMDLSSSGVHRRNTHVED
jgi:hypothetical protein